MNLRNNIGFSVLVVLPFLIVCIFIALLSTPLDWLFFGVRRHGRQGIVGPLALKTKMAWCASTMRMLGIKVIVEGALGELKQKEGAVYVSNHQSIVDILVLMSILPPKTSFLAKKELKWIPFFGLGAEAVGTIFIDRARGTQNEALSYLGDLIQRGTSLIFFPEGTRSLDGKLLNLKRGAFVTAIQAKARVVPIVMLGTRELCPKHSLGIGAGIVKVIIGSSIQTQGMAVEDRFELAQRARQHMLNHLEESSARNSKLEKSDENRKNKGSA